MKASIALAQTDQRERIVKAAVTAVYDRYCSGAIAELESAVVALIGQPLPDEEEEDVVLGSVVGNPDRVRDLIHHRGSRTKAVRQQRRADPVLTPTPPKGDGV